MRGVCCLHIEARNAGRAAASDIGRFTLSTQSRLGSRTAQPARVRRFIDLVIDRLSDNSDFVLEQEELMSAHAKGLAA